MKEERMREEVKLTGSQERKWGVDRGVVEGREALVSCWEDQSGDPLMSAARMHTHSHSHAHTPVHSIQPVEWCDLWIQKQQDGKTTETQTGSHPSESSATHREVRVGEDQHLSHTLFFTCCKQLSAQLPNFHSASCLFLGYARTKVTVL